MKSFNFYVLRKSALQDTTLMLQVDAVCFLARNNFDFNKLLSQGITYTQLQKASGLKDSKGKDHY